MSLNHVILGLLNREPLTGYEMKKIIQSTPFMYWSGNNNQIYKAVVELLEEGYVTKKVEHQEGAPSKNIYTLTGGGQSELNRWLLGETDALTLRNKFLIKLALSPHLKRGDLKTMLTAYERAVEMQAALTEKELSSCHFSGQGSPNEKLFMDLIHDNVLSLYSGELAWIQKAKEQIGKLPDDGRSALVAAGQKEQDAVHPPMDYQIIESQKMRYLYFRSGSALFQREQEALNIVSLCAEHDTNAVVLESESFSGDFVRLRTGLAGTILQKFGNFNVKVAVIIKDVRHFPERFQEMLHEHKAFRVYTNLDDAKNWIER